MSKIISIGTALPEYRHSQEEILDFMQRIYTGNEQDKRRLRFLYRQGGIETRYSILPDYSLPAGSWTFYPASENLEPFPNLEKRMTWYQDHACGLSLKAIRSCLEHFDGNITHLVTVSCTGMCAPGLDLELVEALRLPPNTIRTSVNFMGCYAAIHAMKIADAFCRSDGKANVLIVCTELCTLHFQKEPTMDNMTSSMLFADGAAALIVTGNGEARGLTIEHFYSSIKSKGRTDMAWQLSSRGFQMTLSAFIPELIGEDFEILVRDALESGGLTKEEITHWCIHPGGKRILEAVQKSLGFDNGQLIPSYEVLQKFGNMSSPTVLFVLDSINRSLAIENREKIFGAAFGPGLSVETFILSA